MAVVVDTRSNNWFADPRDYGCRDWHHDPDGKVSYPYYVGGKKPNFGTDEDDGISLEDQRWHEDCSDEALDNLMYGRHQYSAIRDGFDEWERWERMYN